jgi:hypothetical protein
MKKELTLTNPILINGVAVSALSYDISHITAALFVEAEKHKHQVAGNKGGNASGAVEIDYGFHLYLGYAAIIAINPSIDFLDLERIEGPDVLEIMKIGRRFAMPKMAAAEEAAEAEERGEKESTGMEPTSELESDDDILSRPSSESDTVENDT